MYLAYSALKQSKQKIGHRQLPDVHINVAHYNAHQAICAKYAREIQAIQKYMPGWEPAFNY